MRLKERLIGGAVTLIVSVVAGVVVWFLTNPWQQRPGEKLVYAIERVAELDFENSRLLVLTVRFANLGDAAARQVSAAVALPSDIVVAERQITSSAGPGSTLQLIERNDGEFSIQTPSLAPQEIVTATFITRGSWTGVPEVGFRSENQIGVKGDLRPDAGLLSERPTVWILIAAFAAGIPVALVLSRTVSRRLVRLSERQFWRPSRNDAAFLLIQKGLIKNAISLLERAINDRGATPFELANYGLCLALNDNNNADYESYFALAEWWADKDKHAKAVVCFNRATLFFSKGLDEEGLRSLNTAVEYSPVEIAGYCGVSIYLQSARERNKDVDELISKASELMNSKKPSRLTS